MIILIIITLLVIKTIAYAFRPMISRASHASPEQSVLSIPIGSIDRRLLTVMLCDIS